MDDLISRAAAIEAAIDGADDWDGAYNPERERCIREHMANVPAVDAAPVVRCAGCKHWDTDWIPKGTIQGFHFCPMVGFVTREDFYCAYGERRDGDT